MMLSMQAARMGSVSNKIGRCTYSMSWRATRLPLRGSSTLIPTTTTKTTTAGTKTTTTTTTTETSRAFSNNSNRSSMATTTTSMRLSLPLSSWSTVVGRRTLSTAAEAQVRYNDDMNDDEPLTTATIMTTPPTTPSTVSSTAPPRNGSNGAASPLQVSTPSSSLERSMLDEPWRVNLGREHNESWLHGPRPSHWFTGLTPSECPGVDPHTHQLRSIPLPHLHQVTRQSAQDYFDNSWTLYETLFAGLKGSEGFYRPPIHGLRHPQIFYYGHTACLYINKLRVSGVLQEPVNPYYESIFEVGVDEMLWDDMHKNDMLWPTVSEVHQYRKQVYDTVRQAIQEHPSLDDSNGPVQVDAKHPMWALFMGFEHERIHLETSSVLFRETPIHLVQTPTNWPPLHPSAHKRTPLSHPQRGIDYPENRMIPVREDAMTSSQSRGNDQEGRVMSVDLGKPADFPSYGWDNEYGERKVVVPPFHASEHMVTNGEYYEFVSSGGYVSRQFWCDDGWAWRSHRNLKWPFFWHQEGPAGSHQYSLRTIFEIVSMPWDWPVDVNYYEAKAYCRWKTATEGSPTRRPYRILTEAEHHIIRHKEHNLSASRKDPRNDKVMVTSGRDFPDGPTGANINLAYSSQNPVDFFLPSQTGHRDTTGSAWEWTEDHFNPLRGFEHHAYYDDFSTPCFDGKHSMIVGGSFISTGDEASVFARFHFRPHFLQHSGFRLVASDDDAPATHLFANFEGQKAARDAALAATHVPTSSSSSTRPSTGAGSDDGVDSVYESTDSLHMYLGLHYPASGVKENVPAVLPHSNAPNHATRFPQRVAQLLTNLRPARTNNCALDIGCAVGGSAFELAKTFEKVDAFDFSNSFVRAAQRMQRQEEVTFRIPVEADLYEDVQAVHEPGTTQHDLSKVNFFSGDACRLVEMQDEGILDTYDGVVMSNLLCRLPDPMKCLEGLPHIVNPGGVVVLVTPFSWLPEFTPKGQWLGGFYDPVSREPIHSKDVLRHVMERNGFDKIHEDQMPLVIREHQRKYQYIVSEATGWRKAE